AEGNTEPVRVVPDVVVSYLGVPRFELEEVEQRTRVPGVATGLAWTPAGGDVLFVEATRMRGAHTLTLTGQLGEVMKESVQAALRAGIRTIVLPRRNEKNLLEDVPTAVRQSLSVHLADTIGDVLAVALEHSPAAAREVLSGR